MLKRRFSLGFLTAALMVSILVTAGLVHAADERQGLARSVLELFTSQGCSSCPPADALLARLAKRGDIIALTFPVDYWDYLGWKDTLASPDNSARQRAYAETRGDHAVYTPQMVVNGVKHVLGADLVQIDAAIDQTRRQLAPQRVPLKASLMDGTLVIEIGAAAEEVPEEGGVVWLALIKSSVNVVIQRGENAGHTITYTNVVRDLMPVGKWTGEPMSLKLPTIKLMRHDADACVVMLQQGMTGPILAAVSHRAK